MTELSRLSGHLDLNIEDDVDFSFTAFYKLDDVAVDVTGYSATFTVRNRNGQVGPAILVLTNSAGITVGTTDGSFAVSILDFQAVFGDKEMVYDLVIVSPGGVDLRLLRGNFTSWAGAR